MRFNNINIDHINLAVKDFKEKGFPIGFGPSKYFDVEIQGVLYPPKPIMAYANYHATGDEPLNNFSGGTDTPCFRAFERLDILIVEKSPESFKDQLFMFLDQAKTSNLKAKHFISSYNNTKVSVSFGKGVAAKIPWITFLIEPNTTNKGIYPGYLLYKDLNLLVLTYGVSEENPPPYNWNIKNVKTVESYLNEFYSYKPFRYGKAFFFKAYELDKIESYKTLDEDLNTLIDIYKKTLPIKDEMKVNFPLNTILYGPPGTGKTHSTILRAAQIIENREIESYTEALDIFKTNLHDRIEFITFHQNYSYEDFIQGLRPETEGSSSLSFYKRDGVFKQIADKALENIKAASKDSKALNDEARFNIALERFQEVVEDQEGDFYLNDTAYIFEVEKDAFRYTGERWANHTNGVRMKFSDLREFYNNDIKGRKEIKKLTNVSGLAVQHASYFYLAYREVMKYLPKQIENLNTVEEQNYVIIIDEINRANISRVFGELITLIEPDKRSNGAIPLEAKLPSGDTFIVPSNLYIIGTMNTADKSIALLDIALRRRFEFESLYPKYEIDGHEIYDVDILQRINEEIISSKGHDFQIGHAYFMGDNNDLVERMNKKVIPLLLEYYMNDEKEVKDILSKAGLEVEDKSWPLKITGKK